MSLPKGLPGLRGSPNDAQEVVAELKRDARGKREPLERADELVARTREDCADAERPGDRVAARLQDVRAFDVLRFRGAPDHIELLSGDGVDLHLRERAERSMDARRALLRPRDSASVAQRHAEVAGEDRGRCAEARRAIVRREQRVHGRAAASHVVLVHPVVVDEEVRMQELDRDGRVESRLEIRRVARRSIPRDDERGAESLASAQAQVPQRAHHVDDFVAVVGGGVHLRVEEARETRVDVAAYRFEKREEWIGFKGLRRGRRAVFRSNRPNGSSHDFLRKPLSSQAFLREG